MSLKRRWSSLGVRALRVQQRSSVTRRRRQIHWSVGAVVVAALAVVGLVWLGVPHGASPAASSSTALHAVGGLTAPRNLPNGVTLSYPVSVPTGYSNPSGLATAASSVVWYFAESATQDTLFRFDQATGNVSRIQIPPTPALRSGLFTPMALDGTTAVWIGINSTLVEVNQTTGRVTLIDLPPIPLLPPTVAQPPSAPAGEQSTAYEGIESLSIEPNGTVVVGRLFASALQTYSPITNEFGQILLPGGSMLVTAQQDLSTSSTGLLSTLLWTTRSSGSGVLAQWDGTAWKMSATSCGADTVSSTGADVLVSGQGCAALVSQAPDAVASTQVAVHQLTALPNLTGTGALLGGSAALLGTGTGAQIIDSQGAVAVELGTMLEGPSVGGGESGSQQPGTREVPIRLGLTASAGDGSAWFTLANGSSMIGRVTFAP